MIKINLLAERTQAKAKSTSTIKVEGMGSGQNLLLEFVSDFERMSRTLEAGPRLGEHDAELLEFLIPVLVREAARPDPLDTERRLSPAFGSSPLCVGHFDARSPARHEGKRFVAKLQRNTRLNRQEIQRRSNGANVRRFTHG